jgi:hypothetical protein
MHTFEPHIIEGVYQEHLLVLTNKSYVSSVKKQLMQLQNNNNIRYINQEEYTLDGNSHFRVTVCVGRPRCFAHSA